LKKPVPPLKPKTDTPFTQSVFGQDIDTIRNEEEHPEDEEPAMPSNMEMEKRYDPAHPYCTNWPMSKKEKNENI
jgi:hypothetical protein